MPLFYLFIYLAHLKTRYHLSSKKIRSDVNKNMYNILYEILDKKIIYICNKNKLKKNNTKKPQCTHLRSWGWRRREICRRRRRKGGGSRRRREWLTVALVVGVTLMANVCRTWSWRRWSVQGALFAGSSW